MKVVSIYYENFRNHKSVTLEPSEGINLIYGPNGSGKTSLLEGIHYCALTRGLNNATDNECLSFSYDYFLIECLFEDDRKNKKEVKVIYKKDKDKEIIVNNCDLKPFSRHIGSIPCITFSPSELGIVNGSPLERRRFIDNAISQTDRSYLDDLLTYRKVLNHRNSILVRYHNHQPVHETMLSLWTESLAKISASIIYKRIKFISFFLEHFTDLYRQLSTCEIPSIHYRSSYGIINNNFSVDDLYTLFLTKYQEIEKMEVFRAQTLAGPHRDDLIFMINNYSIKKYASQGQLRSFLIALKLAQSYIFYNITGEKPISLLDDIFSELDNHRIDDFFTILESCGQTIITSTEKKGTVDMEFISVTALEKGRK